MATAVGQFLESGWGRHDSESAQVLAEGRALIPQAEGAEAVALGRLLFHVAGEHLGRFGDAVAVLTDLRARPGADQRTLWRFTAAAHVCAGERDQAKAAEAEASAGNGRPPESERGAVHALAAAALLGQHRYEDAARHFGKALYCAWYAPGKDDPLARALAVMGNNLAAELETRTSRTPEQDKLMLTAAETGRRYWEVAGDWTHVEAAEYRLALTCATLKLGARALEHARTALALCDQHGADAVTRFFAHEAAARALAAAGEREQARAARDRGAAFLPSVAEGDRGYCESELAKLDSALESRSH